MSSRSVKRNLRDLHKVCVSCERRLPAACYVYDQSSADRLRDICRTCESHTGKPTRHDVIAFEATMQNIYEGFKGDVNERRSEFEAYVYNEMKIRGLLDTWKPPVWIHKTSTPISQ